MHAKSLQSCLTLSNPVNCSPPGSSVHSIFQARILERFDISTPGGLLDPGIKPASLVSPAFSGRFFATVPLEKSHSNPIFSVKSLVGKVFKMYTHSVILVE